MPYVGGETAAVGDYVKNEWEQPGTVTRVHESKEQQERINVRWDDGGLSLSSLLLRNLRCCLGNHVKPLNMNNDSSRWPHGTYRPMSCVLLLNDVSFRLGVSRAELGKTPLPRKSRTANSTER
jgi:hypothetical protein